MDNIYIIFTAVALICACSTPESYQPISFGDTITYKAAVDISTSKDLYVPPPKDTTIVQEEDSFKGKDIHIEFVDTEPYDPELPKIPEKDVTGVGPGVDVVKPDMGPTPDPCVDNDKDGFGMNCPMGVDCDDNNPNFATTCPDCTTGSHPGCDCKAVAVNCYSGNAGNIGKGVCQAGVQLCLLKGSGHFRVVVCGKFHIYIHRKEKPLLIIRAEEIYLERRKNNILCLTQEAESLENP